MRTSLSIVAILLLGACDPPDEKAKAGYIAPLDGQSNVATNTDLLVHTGGLDLPEKYAIPQNFIQVVDLSDGGFVDGEVVRDGDDLRFLPDKPWKEDNRYVWSLSQVPQLPRSPEVHIPQHLIGEAVFDTSPEIEILDLLLDSADSDDARPCALFSREIVAPNAQVVVTLDDTIVDEVTFDIYSEDEWNSTFKSTDNDPGVSVVCFNIAELQGDESLRLWWNESGPWQADLAPGKLEQSLKARRRSK